MTKIYGLFGTMTGKLADTVMSVRNGEQIARKYQPVVYNPNTPAQIAQRAKLKLMSQLSAIMAPVIAMPRVGSVSSRNLFTKENIGLTSYSSDTASVTLTAIQLTKSTVGLEAVDASRTEKEISVGLRRGQLVDVDRVVYAMFSKGANGKLRYVSSKVATEIGPDVNWGVTFPSNPEEVVILAYGVRDNTEAARASFGNLQSLSGETVANLIVTRQLLEKDVTLTETRGFQLDAAE